MNTNIHNLEVGDKLGGDTIVNVTNAGIRIRDDGYLFRFKNINKLISGPDSHTQFHLTKNTKTMKKELIGYKLKETKYQAAVNTLADGVKNLDTYTMTGNSHSIQNFKDAGVLDIWFEPVYKSEEVTVKVSGNRTLTIKPEEKVVLLGSEKITFHLVESIEKFMQGSIVNCGFTISHEVVNVGCQKFTKQDVVDVHKAIQSLK